MTGNKLVEIMKKTAVRPESELTDMLFGKVTSINPIKIRVDNRFDITSSFIVLTSAVSDFSVQAEVGGVQQTYTIHLGLQVGEDVILLRTQRGQKFIIIDRVR